MYISGCSGMGYMTCGILGMSWDILGGVWTCRTWDFTVAYIPGCPGISMHPEER